MNEYSLTVSEDEALVLFEYFARFDDADDLSFQHPAEYLALTRLAGQIDRTTPAILRSDYRDLLAAARGRIADGFEGEVPCLKASDA